MMLVAFGREGTLDGSTANLKPERRDSWVTRVALWPDRRVLVELAEQTAGRRLLDVGCGDGRLVALATRLGWDAIGCDPDSGVALHAWARDLPVVPGAAAEAPKGPFDVIVCRYVLEHVPEPGAVLRNLAGRLAPGGVLVAWTPNAAGLNARLFGPRWFQRRRVPGDPALLTAPLLADLVGDLGLDVRVATPLTPAGVADFGASVHAGLDPEALRGAGGWPRRLAAAALGLLWLPIEATAAALGRGAVLCLRAIRTKS